MTIEDDPPLDPKLAAYLAFARAHPEMFANPPDGGVRILLDPADISGVEAAGRVELRRQGLPEEGARIGIIGEDAYFILLRDAVEFPDGARRAHTRAANRIGDGSAVLPLFEGRIVLTRQYRHAPRRWMLEIPRGAIELGCTPEDAAYSEVREEVGGEISELVKLGFLHGASNFYCNGAHLFFARLTRVGGPQIEEAISAVEQVTIAEFEALLLKGEILDSSTIAAYSHAKLRGLI